MALVIKAADVAPKAVSDIAQRRTVSGQNLMVTRYEAKAGAEFEAHSHPEEQMSGTCSNVSAAVGSSS